MLGVTRLAGQPDQMVGGQVEPLLALPGQARQREGGPAHQLLLLALARPELEGGPAHQSLLPAVGLRPAAEVEGGPAEEPLAGAGGGGQQGQAGEESEGGAAEPHPCQPGLCSAAARIYSQQCRAARPFIVLTGLTNPHCRDPKSETCNQPR